jgi:hypothetical protein
MREIRHGGTAKDGNAANTVSEKQTRGRLPDSEVGVSEIGVATRTSANP